MSEENDIKNFQDTENTELSDTDLQAVDSENKEKES
jgi:hypothetical protein